MSFIILKWALRGINMNLLTSLEGFQALVIRRGDTFVLVDPWSP